MTLAPACVRVLQHTVDWVVWVRQQGLWVVWEWVVREQLQSWSELEGKLGEQLPQPCRSTRVPLACCQESSGRCVSCSKPERIETETRAVGMQPFVLELHLCEGPEDLPGLREGSVKNETR